MAESSSPPTEDLSGRALGDFDLIRRLASGGMGDVYLARQISLQRQVAFKVLKASLAADPAYVRRFLNEARSAAQVVHPNIVQIFDVGEVEGVHYIAQEYVQGSNLRQLLQRGGPLRPAVAVNIMRQVVLALNKAAEQGVIHRDIKPENIMLASTGEVKVADFGLARAAAGGDEGVGLTQLGLVMGTPLYMSPEQLEGRPVDSRTDLYSLGVTFYHMLAGQTPFQGETPLALAVQHLHHEPPRLERMRSDLPQELCQIIHRLLEKKPERRYQRALDLLRDLRKIDLGGEGGWPEGVDELTTTELLEQTEARAQMTRQLSEAMAAESRRLRQRRRLLWLMAGGVLLAGGLGAGAAHLLRPPPLLAGAGAAADSGPKPLATLQDQYAHALIVGTEVALRAVWEEHQPRDAQEEFLVRKAKRRLAQLYLSQNRPEDARELFDELAALGDAEREFQVFGLAGQAVLLHRQQEVDQASERVRRAFAGLRQLDPAQRQRLLDDFQSESARWVADRLRELSADSAATPDT